MKKTITTAILVVARFVLTIVTPLPAQECPPADHQDERITKEEIERLRERRPQTEESLAAE